MKSNQSYLCPSDRTPLEFVASTAPPEGTPLRHTDEREVYRCTKCGETWAVGPSGLLVNATGATYLPDFLRRSLDILGRFGSGSSTFEFSSAGEGTVTVPTVASSSSAAADLTAKLDGQLRALAARVDGDVRKDINRAADDARAAAEQARGAAQAARLLHSSLEGLRGELSAAGLLQMKTDLAELRRQLYEHIDRHTTLAARSRKSSPAKRER